MKKRIENIKRQAGEEGKKVAFVILGFISGAALAKGMDKLGEKYPQMESAIKYSKPIVLAGGGFILSAATDRDETELKHFGYGLTTSGVFEGVKLIPVAKEYLSGIEGNLGRTYYMENDKPVLELGEFGIHSLPMKSIEAQQAPKMNLELPELETVNGTNLGYSGSQTDEERMSGII